MIQIIHPNPLWCSYIPPNAALPGLIIYAILGFVALIFSLRHIRKRYSWVKILYQNQWAITQSHLAQNKHCTLPCNLTDPYNLELVPPHPWPSQSIKPLESISAHLVTDITFPRKDVLIGKEPWDKDESMTGPSKTCIKQHPPKVLPQVELTENL